MKCRWHSSQHLISHHLGWGLDEGSSPHLAAETIQLPQSQRQTKIPSYIYYLISDLRYKIRTVLCGQQFKLETRFGQKHSPSYALQIRHHVANDCVRTWPTERQNKCGQAKA